MRSRLIERAVEVPAALLALIFFSPLMIVISIAIKLDGGSVLYRQTRIGRDGQSFDSLKFRTMVVDADVRLELILARDSRSRREWDHQHSLQWDPRTTRIGEHLRSSSLDELPQLFNVLRGKMSLVGPRPIVPAEASRYGRRIAHYCSIRPGLTGLWQLKGRKGASYRRRVAMDVYYARHHSAALYFAIIIATIPTLFLEPRSVTPGRTRAHRS